MASLEEIRDGRIKKLRLLKEKGIEPYPAETAPHADCRDLAEKFDTLAKKKSVTAAGRIMAIRGQGALAFFTLDDGTGTFQGLIKKDESGEEAFSLFTETVDIGDFVQATGSLFVTNRGEKTLQVKAWRMLAKNLRPLPEKFHGLADVEERFRRRYLDLLMDGAVKERFTRRSKLVSEIRRFFDKEGFLEVETPRLQTVAGGATAEPFVTHHHALDADFYLTIAQELYLKELLIGGFRKVYEIGRKFRNEGIDVTHNPEFTMLESQEAYADASALMDFTERLLRHLVTRLFDGTAILFDGNKIDFKEKFSRVSFYDLTRRYALIPEPEKAGRDELALKATQLGVAVAPADPVEKILDNIYKKVVRPKLIQPTFITDYPVAFNPFAKRKAANPELIDRFQLLAGGLELVNAFSELNDPLDQKARYEEQDRKKRQGEGDISPSDQAYLEAMEYGMPPNGGIGIGIDRLAMLFTDQHNIREVILFPTLRPKKD